MTPGPHTPVGRNPLDQHLPERTFTMTSTPTAAPLRVTVWGENRHEQRDQRVRDHYPEGMHSAIRDGIVENLGENVTTRIALLDDPEHGLTEEVLSQTDVLTWWGHMAHDEVSDEVAERVQKHVLAGMGLVVLHSGHWSKPFTRLMGTTCTLRWRNEADRELVWTVNPSHPIAEGVPHPIVIPEQEMYGEHFDIPVPDELVFVSSFSGGEVFRSGCTFRRGKGKIFYFSPGDQDYPVYQHTDVRRVVANGVSWARPAAGDREVPFLDRYETDWFLTGSGGQGLGDAEAAGKSA